MSDKTGEQVYTDDVVLRCGRSYQRVSAAFSWLRDKHDIRVAGVGVGDVEGLGYYQLVSIMDGGGRRTRKV
jgi:hypothetical protein